MIGRYKHPSLLIHGLRNNEKFNILTLRPLFISPLGVNYATAGVNYYRFTSITPKMFYRMVYWANPIKLFTAVLYEFS